MGSYTPNMILPNSLQALLYGQIRSFTAGQLEWIEKANSSTGEIFAVLAVHGCRNGRLIMNHRRLIPFRPTFSFVVNDVPAYRVCVNDDTNGVAGTHGHRYLPATGGEYPHSLSANFLMIKDRSRPTNAELKAAFEEFADLVNVDLNDGYWVDP